MTLPWNIELTDLRYFCHVAETLSFSRGAERAHVSKPAISKAIKKVEEAVGARLFERTTRRVTLTEAGETLLLHTRRVFAALEDAHSELAAPSSALRGVIRVATEEVFSVYALPRAIAALRRQHPELDVYCYMMSPEAMEENLLAGTIDVGFCVGERTSPHLQCRSLHQSPARVVCGATHPLFNEARTHPESGLAQYPFVTIQRFGREHLPPLDGFPDARVTRTIGATVGSLPMCIQLVVDGAYLGYLPQVAIRCQLNHDELRVLEWGHDGPPLELCALLRGGSGNKRAATRLTHHVADSLEDALVYDCAPM